MSPTTVTPDHFIVTSVGTSELFEQTVVHFAECNCGWTRTRYSGSGIETAVARHLAYVGRMRRAEEVRFGR